MGKINIAIDGPSSAGKSSVSQEVAKKLNYIFINTGSIYRAIAYYLKINNIDFKNEKEVNNNLKSNLFILDDKEHIFLNNEDISLKLRADRISKIASIIAQYKKVRQYVVDFVQSITKAHKGYIMDGRDTTFKIMPYAELKIFLTATPEERAKRRIIQNHELGYQTDYQTVLDEIKVRDYHDMNRENDPLHIVEGANVIDCTQMTFDEVVSKIVLLVKEKEGLVNEK